VAQVPDNGSVSVRGPNDQQAGHPSVGNEIANGLDLAIEPSHVVAEIRHEVDDLDDEGFSRLRAFEEDVDKTLDTICGAHEGLGARRPAARRGDLDDELLTPQMLEVSGWGRAGRELEECGQLQTDGGGQRCPCLNRPGHAHPAFRLADPALGHADVFGDGGLRQSGSLPARLESDSEAIGDCRRSSSADQSCAPGSFASGSFWHAAASVPGGLEAGWIAIGVPRSIAYGRPMRYRT
jgi:hypothetical protein